MSAHDQIIRLATRGSALALWQAEFVAGLIRRFTPGISVEIVPISTRPDRLYKTPLADMGGDKGLFVKELEQALIDGRADAAVHSLKDVPVEEGSSAEIGSASPALSLVAFPARANPADVFLSRSGVKLLDLPPGSTVATSALRRQAQVLRLRPDLAIQGVRGNVDTRLRKLRDGEFDAIIMATAGLERLGLENAVTEQLPDSEFLPAPGQGILVVQAPAVSPLSEIWKHLDDPTVRLQAETERLFTRKIGATCHSAAGCYLEINNGECQLRSAVFSHDGKRRFATQCTFPRAISADERAKTVCAAASKLLAEGAGVYL